MSVRRRGAVPVYTEQDMLEALCDGKTVRAARELNREAVYRCKDDRCNHPEMELCAGTVRHPYFRHKRRSHCYWHGYKETDWHLEWKSHFDCVEVYMGDDENGSANWADAVVGENFVIEFQHSGMKEEERAAREKYYTEKAGGMVWIVDAYKPRYLKRLEKIELSAYTDIPSKEPFRYVLFPEEAFNELWIDRPVGVIFDYGPDKDLFYLLPGYDQYDLGYGAKSPRAVGRFYKRDELIEELKNNTGKFSLTPGKIRALHRAMLEQKKREETEARAKAAAEARAKAKADRERQLAERNARYYQFEKLRKDAEGRALAKQRMHPKGPRIVEQIGSTNFWIDVWGVTYVRTVNGYVQATPRFE